MNILKRLKRQISAWKFVHDIGKLPKQYAQLSGDAERIEFSLKHFGKDGYEVLEQRQRFVIAWLKRWKVRW